MFRSRKRLKMATKITLTTIDIKLLTKELLVYFEISFSFLKKHHFEIFVIAT